MKTFSIVIFLMLSKAIAAQYSSEIIVPAGKTISEVLTTEKIYQHSNFSRGKVFYKDGTETSAMMNYNFLSGNIEFIGPKNDTLVIAKELILNIKKILINDHIYFHNEIYAEQVEENALGRLLKRQVFSIINREKIGAYNQPSSLAAISTVGNMTDNNSFSRSLKVRENTTMALKSNYFFANQNGDFLPATKKDLIKTYPSKKRQIEDYLKQQQVDFKNGEDLKKLFLSLPTL